MKIRITIDFDDNFAYLLAYAIVSLQDQKNNDTAGDAAKYLEELLYRAQSNKMALAARQANQP